MSRPRLFLSGFGFLPDMPPPDVEGAPRVPSVDRIRIYGNDPEEGAVELNEYDQLGGDQHLDPPRVPTIRRPNLTHIARVADHPGGGPDIQGGLRRALTARERLGEGDVELLDGEAWYINHTEFPRLGEGVQPGPKRRNGSPDPRKRGSRLVVGAWNGEDVGWEAKRIIFSYHIRSGLRDEREALSGLIRAILIDAANGKLDQYLPYHVTDWPVFRSERYNQSHAGIAEHTAEQLYHRVKLAVYERELLHVVEKRLHPFFTDGLDIVCDSA